MEALEAKGARTLASRRVGKIARHCDDNVAELRNFAHAGSRQGRSCGQRAARPCYYSPLRSGALPTLQKQNNGEVR